MLLYWRSRRSNLHMPLNATKPLLIVRGNYSIPKQHKLANNFLNQKTLVADTKWQDSINNFDCNFLKMTIRQIHKMTHVAHMVATQPITYPYTLASRSQLKMTRFIIRVKMSSILTQTRIKVNVIFIWYKFKF